MQQEIDTKNAVFWNELCGSGLARQLIAKRHQNALLAAQYQNSLREYGEIYQVQMENLKANIYEQVIRIQQLETKLETKLEEKFHLFIRVNDLALKLYRKLLLLFRR